MWPWEHLAFGYMLYSGGIHLRYRRAPDEASVIVLAFATQLPDLIDKPLAWTFHVLPSGVSLAHSILFGVPFLLLVVVVTRRFGVPQWGYAMAVGYLSHLAGDIIFAFAKNGRISPGIVLWPLLEGPTESPPGFIWRVQDLFASFLTFLETPAGTAYITVSLGTMVVVFALWVYDGVPGVRYTARWLGIHVEV